MVSLMRIDIKGKVEQLEPAPFANEVDELQNYIRKNPLRINKER